MPMNLYGRYHVLMQQQLAFQEGLELLRRTRSDLLRDKDLAGKWGQAAVVANGVLIPLNCIVNAFALKAAKSLYEVAARSAYDYFSRSGTRSEGSVAKAVSVLKDVAVAELKRKSLGEFIPGAAILFGLAQDSIALWQSAQLVSAGSQEMIALLSAVDWNIERTEREMRQIGTRLSSVMESGRAVMRTA